MVRRMPEAAKQVQVPDSRLSGRESTGKPELRFQASVDLLIARPTGIGKTVELRRLECRYIDGSVADLADVVTFLLSQWTERYENPAQVLESIESEPRDD